MGSAYFAPLVLLPTIITKPGKYRTRNGETVTIESVSSQHDYNCVGAYDRHGIREGWHKSGRIMATSKTLNDIIGEA
jgi:hypothetical protein